MKAQVEAVDLVAEVRDELAEVDQVMMRVLETKEAVLYDAATHLLRAGGKRLRPALVLLCSRLYTPDPGKLVPLAAAVELIHMATLVHDDVIDKAITRRGFPTVNAKWSDKVSVLSGDYLFAKAFSILSQHGDNRVVRMMADVVYEMCTGEMGQVARRYSLAVSEGDYLGWIGKKTAYFIAECCRMGALVSGAAEPDATALHRYGYGIGMGFQIVDDVLDLTATAAQLGKPVGGDLRGGVITLPVIHALENSAERERLGKIISSRRISDAEVRHVSAILHSTGSLHYAYNTASRYIDEAKDALAVVPEVPTRRTLALIADFVISRHH